MEIIKNIKILKATLRWIRKSFLQKEDFAYCGYNTILQYPLRIYSPKSVYIEENVKLSAGLSILNAPTEKVIIKKYTSIAANCTIIPNSHRSTVTIPQFLLGASHINDTSTDIIINEDVWIGANVIILPGVELGRGCIISAGSIVTKSVPPYALVIGSPAKIHKVKFNIDQILKHESTLYSEEERFNKQYLEELFNKYYLHTPCFGVETIPESSVGTINELKKVLHFREHIVNY